MSFLNLARSLAQVGIKTAGDVARPLTLRRTISSGYNITTDQHTNITTDYATKGIETKEKKDEDDNSSTVAVTSRFLIARLDLAVTPIDRDVLVDAGKIWEIVQIKTDPAEALWIISVREP